MIYFYFSIAILFSFNSFSQHITARVIDKKTKNPIPYATIKTGEYSGVISNEDGYFTISTDDEKQIIISCMGYTTRFLNSNDIKKLNNVIALSEALNTLDEVYISNTKPNADTIIARVKRHIEKNYTTELYKYNLFRRSTDYVNFHSLNLEIEKASHVSSKKMDQANKELQALGKQVIESDMKSFSDFRGTLYVFNTDSSKIEVQKATKLLDHKNDFSMDNIEKKGKSIVLTYLDTTKTYKLKTGIFKIEDSLSINDEEFKNDKKPEHNLNYLNRKTRSLLSVSQFKKGTFMDKILNTGYYEYEFRDMALYNDELTYIIDFKPNKGKSKYSGRLYIADGSYAITRVDYDYYKNRHGGKVNLKWLLGVKYIENVSTGTILYEKDSTNIYQPKYIKQLSGSYFYVSRELKFIENSFKKHKIRFDFTLEGDQREQEELLITSNSKLTKEDFAEIKELKKVPIQVLSAYQKSLWENDAIIEPTLEMKAFKASD